VPLKELPPPDPAHVAWVARHAIELRSIDPEHTDFADLQPLKALIGDARIVMLGEQSHGDGAVFHTKTRLIKFLHQEMGFNVLAFESGLYDCRRAWQAFRAGEPPRAAAEQGIFGIWTMSREVQPLLQYIAAQAMTDYPLELAGFDDQMTARASREHLVDDVRDILAGIPAGAVNAETRSTILESLRMLSEQEPLGERRAAFQTACETVREALLQIPAGEPDANLDRAFWAQFFRSIRVYADHTQDRGVNPDTLNLRDRQMAENLAWLAKVQYPERKFIVWAASRHNIANPQIIRGQDGKLFYDGVTAMGHELRSLVDPADIYSIGFTAWEGEAGPWFAAPRRISPARTGSLEDICQRTGKDNLILPLRDLGEDGRWLASPRESRPLGYSPMTADWTQVFDAMVFNRTMTPSRRVPQRE
jgi:erythromycin esterase